MGGRALQRAGRHRRPQGRARDRGRILAEGHDRALQQARAAGESRLRSGHHLNRRWARARPGGGGVAGAHDLLGRHDAGWRGRETPQSPRSVPFDRQRVRGGHVLAARHQELERQVRHRRRNQSRLFLRPQQHGGLRRDPQAVQHRAQGHHRAVAQGRHHGPDQPRGRDEGRQAGFDLLLAAVRGFTGVHEAGACRGPDRSTSSCSPPPAGSTR